MSLQKGSRPYEKTGVLPPSLDASWATCSGQFRRIALVLSFANKVL
jgi:hypothetical protein